MTSVLVSAMLFVAAAPTPAYAQHALLQTKAEVEESNPQGALAALRVLDTDGSGVVDMQEIRNFAQKFGLTQQQINQDFLALDTNGNGQLDENEIDLALEEDSAVTSPGGSSAVPSASANSVQARPAAKPEVPTFASPSQHVASAATAIPKIASPARQLAAAVPTTAAGVQAAPSAQVAPAGAVSQNKPHASSYELLDKGLVLSTVAASAGNSLARLFTETAAKIMKDKVQNEAQAAELEKQAKGLRGQAAALAQNALNSTNEAARRAAMQVLYQTQPTLQDLESRASKATERAQQQHQLAEQHMRKVRDVQAHLVSAIQKATKV